MFTRVPRLLATATLLGVTISAAAAPAAAATVSVDVIGADGKPLAGAVVFVESARKLPGVAKSGGSYEMAQQNIAFNPHVLIVPVGATVRFPNRDKVRHHVYSFSKPRKFDLKLYGKDETRSVVFDKPGIVAVGCNIHDAMNGFVVVAATPYVVQTDARGHATLTGVPAGGATARVWHPTIRAADNMVAQALTVAPGGSATTFALRAR